MKYSIVITYAFSTGWLQKSWQERAQFERSHVRPIFTKYADSVKVRLFDAEAFNARYTDFMIIETEDLKQYYYFIEALRDSALFKQGLAEFKDILLGIEDGFREYEREVIENQAIAPNE